MARAQAMDSAGSQFFIMHADGEFLDGQYAAFGMVTEGMDVVDRIAATKTGLNDKPKADQRMKKVTVETFGVEYPEPEKNVSDQRFRSQTVPGGARGRYIAPGLPARCRGRDTSACAEPMGLLQSLNLGAYWFRRGHGCGNSGRMGLSSKKRATYKLKNNDNEVLAAA